MLCCLSSFVSGLVTLPFKLLGCLLSPCGIITFTCLATGLYFLNKWCKGGRCLSKARLDGKIAIITGANSGIGKETARDFIRRGAKVIMACRDVEKSEIVAAEIRICATNNGSVVVKKLDLSSFKSIRDFCKNVLDEELKIDLLINNAGVMMCPEWKTEDGLEMQIGTNHFGHFLLTNLLLDRLKKSGPSRIINVSSIAHYKGVMNFNNINLTGEYKPMTAYRHSKLANVLFTKELHKRLEGSEVSTFSLHPGVIVTNIGRHIVEKYPWLQHIIPYIPPIIFKNSEEGAQTSIYCAVQEGIEHLSGLYFSDCKQKKESTLVNDDDAKRLWKISEEVTK